MNNKLTPEFESLVQSAQNENEPNVDVTASVMQSIQSYSQNRDAEPADRILIAFTTASVLAASIALILVFDSVALFDHPAFDFVQSSGGFFL